METKLLLTIPDCCARLNLGRSKIYQLINQGSLPVVRIGRAVRVDAKALEEWVARLQEEATEEQGE
jgi:excisionase family DNA binding protein